MDFIRNTRVTHCRNTPVDRLFSVKLPASFRPWAEERCLGAGCRPFSRQVWAPQPSGPFLPRVAVPPAAAPAPEPPLAPARLHQPRTRPGGSQAGGLSLPRRGGAGALDGRGALLAAALGTEWAGPRLQPEPLRDGTAAPGNTGWLVGAEPAVRGEQGRRPGAAGGRPGLGPGGAEAG